MKATVTNTQVIINLELSQEEAIDLFSIAGNIIGNSDTSARGTTDEIYNVLQAILPRDSCNRDRLKTMKLITP